MARIGFIGLGAMGLPMAQNLVARGHDVLGFDSAARPAFTASGGRLAASVREVVEHAETLFTMLPNGAIVLDVVASQVLPHIRPGQLLVDCSTIGVPGARQLHALAAERGLAVLDAPVTGGVGGAQAATLTIMVGGDEAVFGAARELLAAMGSKLVYAGGPGNGQAVKICNNMAAGIIKIAISEAFVLARQLGVDERLFFEVAAAGSAQAFALTRTCPVPGLVESSPSSRGYQNGFATSLMLKDMVLAQEAAMASGAATVLGGAATHLYQLCANAGLGDQDNGIVYQYLSRQSA